MRGFAFLHLIAVAMFASAGFADAAETAEKPVPFADFARHAQFRDIKISPHGDYVAAKAVVDGKAVLSLVHLADMKGVNLRPREAREVADFWWAAPDRVIYTVGDRTGTLEQPAPTGELYAVNADGSGDGTLFGYRVSAPTFSSHIARATSQLAYAVLVDRLPDDPRHALIATYAINGANLGTRRTMSSAGVYPDVVRIDVFTGKTTPVTSAPLRNAAILTDHHGRVRFAYGIDVDQQMKVWYRPEDGEWTLLLDESREHKRMMPLAFDRKEDKVYFTCGGTRNVGGVCVWDVAKRTFSTLWSGSVSGVESLVPSFDDADRVAIRSMPDRAATTLIDRDAPEAKLLVQLMQQFPGEDVRITSSTPDGSKVVFLVESDVDPGEFFLYDASARKASLLFSRMPWIRPAQMAPMEPVALKARDGLALHGYLTRPPGRPDAKGLPLVVYVHGGPYGIRDEWVFDPTVQLLASRGYAVLQVNFRGSGDYGYDFMHAGFREWGGKMQDDVTDATRWAIAQGIADPKRLCIFGASYGGYAALEDAVKEPDLYRCAIGYVGVYDLRLMYTRGDIPQSMFGESYLKMVLGEDQAVLWDRSPIAHLDRLKAKVMLVVGGEDWRVPPIQGERLHAALDKAHVEHEWLYQRNEGHGFYDEKNREDLFMKVIAFLDRSIGVDKVAATSAQVDSSAASSTP